MTAVTARIASVDTAVATPGIVAVPVAQIRIPTEHRKHHANAIQALAEDIDLHGLRQPIEIVHEGDGYRLIFGALRLQAHQYLGRPMVQAIVKEADQFVSEAAMRLVSISENMLRNPLTMLDRSVAIADWCAIYRAAQPPMKPGPKPANSVQTELSANFAPNSEEAMDAHGETFAASFSDAAQAFLNISRRSVFNALKIASIPALQRDRIALHPLADNQGELYAIAQIAEPVRQISVIDLIIGGVVGTVEAALDYIDQRPRNTPAKWEKLSEKFARFHESEQDRFFDLNEASITRWQAKRGRK
ncbi:ParB/RepB/Spo0J family partition protein [Neorhizobium petrolearium]|uniref:ParB/RepB/Spo0J family partition protein n=1 Tax=Neorhizobium petrolearium TaxID=515361 RepID=UPI003F7D05A2